MNNIKSLMLLLLIVVVMVTRMSAQQKMVDIRAAIAVEKSDTHKIGLYKEALNYYKRINLDSALVMADDALKIAESIKDKYATGYLLWQKGIIDREQGRLVIAKDNLDRALEIFSTLGDRKKIAIVKNELGVVEGTKANYQGATKYFLEALAIYEQLHDTMGMGQTYLKLGVVNQSLNNLDQATSYFKQAFVLSRKTGDTLNMAYLYSDMGIVEGMKENNLLSFKYFDSGLALCTTEKFVNIKLGLLLNTGIAHARTGDEPTALAFFKEGLRIARERSMPYDVPNLLLNMALLDHVVKADEKLPLLNEALQKAKEGGQRPLVVNIYRTLADVSYDQGDYKAAYQYLDTFHNEEKDVFSMQKNKEIANLQALYELNKSHGEMAELMRQNYDRNFQRNLIIVFAAIILMALIAVYSSYRKTNRLNEELQQQQAALAASNIVKDKIFSVIGHDLRAPTTTIIGMLHVLESEDSKMSTDERREIYKMLGEHSQASLETLNKLLLWGSREIKGISMQQEHYKVDESVQTNMKLVQERAAEKQLRLENAMPQDTCLYADPSHFDFIVRNLLFNAVKYSFKGGMVKIGVHSETEEHICFYVSDTGMGVSEQAKEQIFTLNSASKPGTDNEKGTGLGLVLCRDFAEMNGGKIWVESQPGTETVFYFTMKKGKC
jgi:signal transduction histidine kinase/Tfp pilus assembly protein PilF